MKELSVKEKAKHYDEAINKIMDYRNGKTKMYTDVNKAIDYLFPELAESEDEKIRIDLINYFNGAALEHREEDVLAWLEKQGEQKPSWSEEDIKKIDTIIGYIASSAGEKLGVLLPCIDWLKYLRHQKQWKPSKEQLQALRWVCNRTFIAQEPQKESALEDLYEQLKAL